MGVPHRKPGMLQLGGLDGHQVQSPASTSSFPLALRQRSKGSCGPGPGGK